ncbi:FAR1 DNA-binding domain protein [Medicago truncatula]|uniref:FAR1 DNA-binding domain protein n=1 Tax=Medicago truncatula TaxID=3880 RepID=A0A072TZZ2_MEDTR|nr:FAR1 DNA-binding domain protein [Medicago truncatula]
MVENADDDDDPVETKSSFVGYSGELKPPTVEVSVDVKSNIDEASFMLKFHMLIPLLCERSGAHKSPKKRLKHESTNSRKCGCVFKLHGYVSRETKDWKLAILNGVHNHELVPSLEWHILAGRLRDDDKKIVHMT